MLQDQPMQDQLMHNQQMQDHQLTSFNWKMNVQIAPDPAIH